MVYDLKLLSQLNSNNMGFIKPRKIVKTLGKKSIIRTTSEIGGVIGHKIAGESGEKLGKKLGKIVSKKTIKSINKKKK